MRFPKHTLLLITLLIRPLLQADDLPEELGIDAIIPLALQNHFSIRIAEIETERSEAAIDTAKGAFETQLNAGVSRGQSDATSSIGQDDTLTQSRPYYTQQNYSIDRTFSTGTTASVTLNATDYDLNPELSGSQLSVELRQNLLRGAGLSANLAPIRIATRQFDISREELRQTIIDTVAEAQFAYFDGVLAEENLRVANESLELARTLLKENQKRAKAGSIASSDLLQTEAEVALREEQSYRAQATLVAAKNRLKRLVSKSTLELLDWDFAFKAPAPPEQAAFDVRAAYALALDLRPDYRQSTLGLEIGEIDELRSRNSALPDVELYARMNLLGYGEHFDDSFKEALSNEQPGYNIGIQVSRTLFNKSRNAELIRAKLATNQLKLTLRQLEQAILLDIDAIIARIESNWRRHQSAQVGNRLAQQSLEAEQKRYQRGTSSTFVLIRLQSDLNNARIRALVAANDYQKSIVELYRQTGQLLRLHNITL
jgi:outer membrane protein TolC